jgi:hypothetical protein
MSGAWGTLSVSGDYEGDLYRIVEVLNDWEFAYGEIWFLVQDDRISTNIGGDKVSWPSAFPRVRWMVFKDGTRVRKDREVEDGTTRNDWTEEVEELPLSTISAWVCPALRKGTLELYIEINLEDEVWWWESLTIRHGGTIEREARILGNSGIAKGASEKFERGKGPLSRLMRGEDVDAQPLPVSGSWVWPLSRL